MKKVGLVSLSLHFHEVGNNFEEIVGRFVVKFVSAFFRFVGEPAVF